MDKIILGNLILIFPLRVSLYINPDFIKLRFQAAENGNQVLNIAAKDLNGSPLLIDFEGKNSYFYYWKVNTNGSNNIVIDYDIRNIWINNDDYWIVWPSLFFLWPTVVQETEVEVSLTFNLPDGWIAATPWEEVNSKYITDYFGLYAPRIGLGLFEMIPRNIEDYNVIIAITEEVITPNGILTEDITKLFQFYLDIFQSYPNDSMMVLAVHDTSGGYVGNSIFFNADYRITDIDEYWVASHEMFHLWCAQ